MKASAILMLLAVPAQALWGQGPLLRGTVTDTVRAPLALAEIIVANDSNQTDALRTARAGADGRFSFPGISPGRYSVTVRRIGFIPIQIGITLEEGSPQTLEFELVPRPQLLPDVVVEVEGPSGRAGGPLFRGVVVDTADQPIALAEVIVGGATPKTRGPYKVTTREQGRFAFPKMRDGRYFITVRRIGYLPVQVSVRIEPETPRTLKFVMYARPFDLPDVVVEALRFDVVRAVRRAHAYEGTFLTRDDIEDAAPVVLGDLVGKYFFGVSRETFAEPNLGFSFPRTKSVLYGLGDTNSAVSAALGFRGVDCPPVISINGQPPRAGWSVNDFDPQQIEAIELYRKKGIIPFEFQNDFLIKRSCGSLMVIWLRRSG